MVGAFVYVTVCSIKNRFLVRVRRLKQPRYLFGSIAGILYFYYFVFGRPGLPSAGRRPGGLAALSELITRFGDQMQLLGAAALCLITALAWLWPTSQAGLAFTRSEVQFLFTAPLTRRQLINYKLLRTQIASFFGSFVMTVLFRRASLAANGHFLVGLWLIMAATSLHLMGVSLTRASLGSHGRSGLARQRVPLIAAAFVLLAVGAVIVPAWPGLRAAASAREVWTQAQALASTGLGAVVFWPFRALTRVPLAPSNATFLRALPGALAVLALNYLWVLRADTAFEEASADAAEKRATQKPGRAQPVVRKSTATPFKLALTGPPETAIVWKNLILIGRYVSLKTLIRILPMIAVLSIMLTRSDRNGLTGVLAIICVVFTIGTVLMGPQMTRNDLRHDLGNLAILKTWPIRGAALLRGEVLAAASILSGFAWIFILSAAFLSSGIDAGDAGARLLLNRISYAAAAMMLAPPLILAQLVIQNGIAVLFPAWITVGRTRGGGIDMMGQRLIMMFGSLLAVVVALVPALVAAVAVAGPIYIVTRSIPIVLGSAVAGIAMLAECWAATEVLGTVLDRTDVGAVEATE